MPNFRIQYKQDYQRALDYIRDMILATDLAHHLKAQDEMRRIITKGTKIGKNNETCRLSIAKYRILGN